MTRGSPGANTWCPAVETVGARPEAASAGMHDPILQSEVPAVPLVPLKDWPRLQRQDPVISQVLRFVERGTSPASDFKRLVLQDGILKRRCETDGTPRFQLVLPAVRRQHSVAYMIGRRDRTLYLLRARSYWLFMTNDAQSYVPTLVERCMSR